MATPSASGAIKLLFWALLTALTTVIVSYPMVTWLFGKRWSWDQRNRSENILTIILVLFASAVVLALLSGPVRSALTSNWTVMRN